jgi:hypothetical protein
MKFHRSSLWRLLVLAFSAVFLSFPAWGRPRAVAGNAVQASRFAESQGALRIPFEMSEGGHIFLRVSVNGSEPLWFGLDSGAEQTMISLKQAKALKLKLLGDMQAAGGGEETVDLSFTRNVAFNLTGVDFVLREVSVLPLEFSSPVAGQPIGGLLGYDFMRRFVVEIDYIEKVINLYKPGTYRYRGRGEIVPIRTIDNNPYIPARVTLPGLPSFNTMLLIDSGADTELFFNSPFVRRNKLLTSNQETTEASTLGIGGASKIRIGKATSIQIGRAVINNLVAHFSLATKGDSASVIEAGFIGGKLLRRFKKVIFDQTRRRLILEPNTIVMISSRRYHLMIPRAPSPEESAASASLTSSRW